jgi:hypothetical protein
MVVWRPLTYFVLMPLVAPLLRVPCSLGTSAQNGLLLGGRHMYHLSASNLLAGREGTLM